MVCSCGRVIRYGFYSRVVEDCETRVSVVRVQRYRCKGCLRTFSRPPSSVVAYKRFDARAIGQVLAEFFRHGRSIARICKSLLYGSYSSFRRWLKGFARRSEAIRCEGADRMAISFGDCGPCAGDVFRRLWLWCGECSDGWVIERVGPVLMGCLPQVGVFHSF